MSSQAAPRLRKSHRTIATFGAAAIILAVGAATYVARLRGAVARQWVTHTYAVMQAAAAVRAGIQDAENGERGFLLLGGEASLAPYNDALATLGANGTALRELTRDNPSQQQRLDTLTALVAARLAEISRTIDLRRTQGPAAAVTAFRSEEGRVGAERIRRVLEDIESEERLLLARREAIAARWVRIVAYTLVLGTFASALIALLVNGMLARFATAQEASAQLLASQNAQLQEQGLELELQHQQLQEQATEVEAQNEELQQQAAELEAQTEEAERSRSAAELANAAKSEFLAAMSHELRTPLNAISGYADLLSLGIRGPVSEPQQQDLRRIKKSSVHLLSLINEILNLARIEAGHLELRLTTVPLAPMLEDVAGLVAPQMQTKGLTCVVGECDAGVAVHTDAEKTRQILLNLLTNAQKFTDRGGHVRVECIDAVRGDGNTSPRMVSVRVRDSGRGIPADKLSVIFEPFVQIDRRLTPEPEQGLGLGLAISRDLARAMGGELAVTSVVGEGSTFTLSLPVASADADVSAVDFTRNRATEGSH